MKPGFETASSSKAAHEIMGLLLVLSSLSAPKRAPTVWTCGSALWFSVCRIWFCSVIFLSPFLPCFSRGKKRQGVPLPAAALTGEPQKISRVSLDFFGGAVTWRAAKPGQSVRRQGGGVFTRLPCPREQARKGDLTERAKPEDRPETNQKGPSGGSFRKAIGAEVATSWKALQCRRGLDNFQ